MLHTSAELDKHLSTLQFLENPYPFYHHLRAADAVHWSQAWSCWLLTRYDDVVATLTDPKRFSNVGTTERFLKQLPTDELARIQPLYQHFTVGLTRTDPPNHTRIRALTSKAFTTRVIELMRRRIQEIVDQLLDAALDRGQIDLIGDFAYPLPATVIAEMFGFPPEDRDRFKAWSSQIAAFHGTGRADLATIERSQTALLEARKWLSELIEARRQQPRDDLLSWLANAEEQGDMLNNHELLATCVTFMIGGHETTTNLIGNGILALLRNPDQLRLLKDEPDRITAAVEELLRYDAPTQRAHRVAAEDIDLRGKTIRKGDFIQQVLGAANRDPAYFPEPDRLDITREKNRHVSFGLGIHFCPGAPLARLEAQIAFPTLLRRLPNLRVADNTTIEWTPNNFFRGLKALPLEFDRSHHVRVPRGGRPA